MKVMKRNEMSNEMKVNESKRMESDENKNTLNILFFFYEYRRK